MYIQELRFNDANDTFLKNQRQSKGNWHVLGCDYVEMMILRLRRIFWGQ